MDRPQDDDEHKSIKIRATILISIAYQNTGLNTGNPFLALGFKGETRPRPILRSPLLKAPTCFRDVCPLPDPLNVQCLIPDGHYEVIIDPWESYKIH